MDNKIIGYNISGASNVAFAKGSSGNILFCDDGVDLTYSKICFNGNDALVYLGRSCHRYMLNLSVNQESTIYIGRDNYFNGKLNIITSERKHVVIGDGGLFSFGIWIRTADPHLIYSCDTYERINPSKNVLIGDHVWIGQGALILKGSIIASGSIIGGNSTVSGKTIRSNESWAGSPVKRIARGVFWDGSCVHNYTKQKTKDSQHYQSDQWIFNLESSKLDSFTIFDALDSCDSSLERYQYLSSSPIELQGKMRFAISGDGDGSISMTSRTKRFPLQLFRARR